MAEQSPPQRSAALSHGTANKPPPACTPYRMNMHQRLHRTRVRPRQAWHACTRPGPWASAVALLALLLTAASARAEDRPAAVGYYAEAGMGATAFLGTTAPHAAVGPVLDLRLGRDLRSWFSLGLRLAASTHEATVPPPPEDEYFQLYGAAADVRLGFRLDRVGAFIEAHVGASAVSSNILAKVGILDPDERFSLTYGAGAGTEYQMENRHYAVGLAGHWMALPQFDGAQGISARLYLRYTY